ncbi:MAG: molybdopterin-guanine dinucleotide biosynthesis protein B [Actinobacteria bacterium]|nr:molybdopterin-guanine dinucleotide biosynthesis protein B [Actinomycetota bacterium]
MLDNLPVMAICGWSGAGKTTLIEQIIPPLHKKGLKVAVVKHDTHGIDVDRPGKDSDRFFRAGADVVLQGPQQELLRLHQNDSESLRRILTQLAERYDLVLVEGHKGTALPKIWLVSEDELAPPVQAGQVLAVLNRDGDRPTVALDILEKWLFEKWLRTPVFGCVLIGGDSSRMGKPKHLLRRNGHTWLQHTAELLQELCEQVVIVGAGTVPDELGQHGRLADISEAEGPMAGLLSAMRWAPQVSWLLAACDLPAISLEVFHWLLATRTPGVWATVPGLAGEVGVEPLLAHYDFRCRLLVEQLASDQEFSLSRLAGRPKIISPVPPNHLASAWQNINTPDELQSYDTIAGRY